MNKGQKEELDRYNDRILDSIESRLHEPDPDSKVYCSLCDEEIPSDGYYYDIGGNIYCPDCMDKYYRHEVDY